MPIKSPVDKLFKKTVIPLYIVLSDFDSEVCGTGCPFLVHDTEAHTYAYDHSCALFNKPLTRYKEDGSITRYNKRCKLCQRF